MTSTDKIPANLIKKAIATYDALGRGQTLDERTIAKAFQQIAIEARSASEIEQNPQERFGKWLTDGPALAKAAGCYVGIRVSPLSDASAIRGGR